MDEICDLSFGLLRGLPLLGTALYRTTTPTTPTTTVIKPGRFVRAHSDCLPILEKAEAWCQGRSAVRLAAMLCGMMLYEVEDALSVAMTQSLRYQRGDRPVFVARHLIGQKPGDGLTLLTEKPKSHSLLKQEIAELTALVKLAVNCASRHEDEPLKRIADHLLRNARGTEAGIETISAAEAQVQAQAKAVAEEEAQRMQQELEELASKGGGSGVISPAKGNILARVLAHREKERVQERGQMGFPMLGKRPSAVLPTVISAFQEQAARKQAREVDHKLIEDAMAAGAKLKRQTSSAVDATNKGTK